jgi:hypothetical protein
MKINPERNENSRNPLRYEDRCLVSFKEGYFGGIRIFHLYRVRGFNESLIPD